MSNESNNQPRHYCDHPDCGKSFRRAEHLTRHKLNHTNATIQCPQCDRLFYRRDLLQRHLTLKHGAHPRSSRGGGDRDKATVPSAPSIDGSSPASQGRSYHAIHPDQPFLQAAEDPHAFANATLPVNPQVHDAAVEDVVMPMSNEMFQFTPPSLDLAQDWGWLHQSPLPVLPVTSEPVTHLDQNNELAKFGLDNTWVNPGSPESLYVSQGIYDFLLTLAPIVESNRPLNSQEATSILNTAFTFLMESVPIFHQPTFSFDLLRRELCATIFCVGLLIAPDQALHQIGCVLLGQIRLELIQYVDQNTVYISDLGVLQAMLLVEFSGMYLADRTAMELSDVFHGTLVTLARRIGLFEMSYSSPNATSVPTEEGEYQTAIDQESAKRLAYFIFAQDIEQALFYGHERSIVSIYSMKLDLPSEERGWHLLSQGPYMQRSHRFKYNSLCHNVLSRNDGQNTIPVNLSQLSNFLLLLGFSSLVLELLRRQQDPFFDTKQALSRLGAVLPAIHGRLMAGPEGRMKLHGRAIYHITVIALCTPLDDLERAANDGFSRTGRTPKQHTRGAIIRLLTKHRVGADPARHAVHLLKLFLTPVDVSPNPVNSSYGPSPGATSKLDISPYEPSSLYFGALTLWAFLIGRVGDLADDESQMQDQPYLSEGELHPSQTGSNAAFAQAPIVALLQGIETAINNDDSASCRSYWRSIVPHVANALARSRNNNAQEYSQVVSSLSDTLTVF